jgi:indole-3-glycerol phosphate synthase
MGRDILSRIVEHKKGEVLASKRVLPESRLREEAFVPRERRSFLGELEHPGPTGVNVIAEIKRASPSKGPIRPDLDPGKLAGEYQKGGAAAISVLTDAHYFQGSVQDLKDARDATTLPVLRKDFLISSYQIYEASAMGADAVLLITRILSADQLKDYLSLAGELSLDALVEVHSEEDLGAACLAGARIIGINNRDLSSFNTNIETAMAMASMLESHQIPVAASGIKGRDDIERTLSAGIWNFLVGESLVRAQDPRAHLESLVGAG